MSQSQPPPEFDSLRRLLALKRHETPPPGFFQNFPGKVIARIEIEQMAHAASWWRRLFQPAKGEGFLNLSNAMTFAGLALVGASMFLVVSGKQTEGKNSTAVRGFPNDRATAGVPGVPASTFPVTQSFPAEMMTLTISPVLDEPATNDSAPAGLFSAPSLRSYRVDFVPSR